MTAALSLALAGCALLRPGSSGPGSSGVEPSGPGSGTRAGPAQPGSEPGADEGAAGPAARERRSPRDLQAFVLGNIEYVLLHELAHVVISDLDVPVIGPEESAADYIATGVLIRADEFDPTAAERARQYLLATATGLVTSWEVRGATDRDIDFWSSHALTIQRFHQIICLVYGSNPETFATLPEQVGMPAARAARCEAEFERADRSLRWLLENFGLEPGEPPGAPVDIVLEAPPTRVSARMIDAMRESGMLDNTVRRLRETFGLPEPLEIVFRSCRAPQALWLPERREVVICYELMDTYYLLGADSRANARRPVLDEPS